MGIIALVSGGVFLFIDTGFTVLILGIFLAFMAAAPFITGRGIFLPVIARGKLKKNAVALTIDDGPDPLTTMALLGLLGRYGVRATFFVTGKNAEKYPDLIGEILKQGHSLGNHSYGHDPMIMLKGKAFLKKEILQTQDILRRSGIIPRVFRPPVGITSPVLGPVLRDAGLCCVNFSARALDRGNRNIDDLSKKILKQIKLDDIIMIHDISPPDTNKLPAFFKEVELLIRGLEQKRLKIIPLADLIGKEVMVRVDREGGVG